MMTYSVVIRGQFVFTTDVDADSPEEARDEAEIVLDFRMHDEMRYDIHGVNTTPAEPHEEKGVEK